MILKLASRNTIEINLKVFVRSPSQFYHRIPPFYDFPLNKNNIHSALILVVHRHWNCFLNSHQKRVDDLKGNAISHNKINVMETDTGLRYRSVYVDSS